MVYLSWETSTAMTKESSNLVAEKAKSFITQNLPESAPDGIVAIGVLSATVVDQATVFTSTGAFLRVKFQVGGLVIGESSFDKESLDFDVLVNDAIRANDGEFLRLVEPLVVGAEAAPKGQGNNGTSEIVLIIVVVVTAIAVVIVLVLIFFAWGKGGKHKADKESAPDEGENIQTIALEEASRNSDRADSIAEQSMYTTAVSRRSMNESTILHLDNGQSVCSKFSVWSFSACSDDEAGIEIDDLDFHQRAEGEPNLIGSSIETEGY